MNLACQACKKHTATVHLTDITPEGEKRECHLCEECARRQGVTAKPPGHVPVHELLAGLVMNKESIQQLAELSCSKCGMTFVEFRNNGLLGCPADYDAFQRALVPLIERAHEGAGHHIGKVPRRLGAPRPAENDMFRLKSKLNKALENEKYEEAAQLRDKIEKLESK